VDLKKLMKDYFDYSRKDRIGILALVILIVLTLLVPAFFQNDSGKPDTAWIDELRSLETGDSSGENMERSYTLTEYQYDRSESSIPTTKKQLFYFDPNTLGSSDWKKLGLRDKTIQTILRFRSRGGRFHKPVDLQKIYGLRQSEYDQINPYVRIAGVTKKETVITSHELLPYTKKNSRFGPIDINTVDTGAFIALPGIGSKLAARIVNFREKLGGFYAVEQIGEVYGLADSTFDKIKSFLKLENIVIRKININTAAKEELQSHPYIKFQLAKQIIAYRNEHGLFSTLEDLKKIHGFSEEFFKKIIPYLLIE
jgi:competence protein ComEA